MKILFLLLFIPLLFNSSLHSQKQPIYIDPPYSSNKGSTFVRVETNTESKETNYTDMPVFSNFTRDKIKAESTEPLAEELFLKDIPIVTEQHFNIPGWLKKNLIAMAVIYLPAGNGPKFLERIPVKNLLSLKDQHDFTYNNMYGYHFILSNYEPKNREENEYITHIIDASFQNRLQSLNIHQFLSDFKNKYGNDNSWYLLTYLERSEEFKEAYDFFFMSVLDQNNQVYVIDKWYELR